MVKASLLWITGLCTFVPCAIYYLLFQAQRDEYALLITLVLFWIFGFWGVVGPIIAAIRVRQVFRAIEASRSAEELRRVTTSDTSKDALIDLIASENRIPRYLARRVYAFAVKRYGESSKKSAATVRSE